MQTTALTKPPFHQRGSPRVACERLARTALPHEARGPMQTTPLCVGPHLVRFGPIKHGHTWPARNLKSRLRCRWHRSSKSELSEATKSCSIPPFGLQAVFFRHPCRPSMLLAPQSWALGIPKQREYAYVKGETPHANLRIRSEINSPRPQLARGGRHTTPARRTCGRVGR